MVDRTLIRGATIISMDPAIGDIEAGDILIENDRIVAVSKSIVADDAEVIDASGMIASPGFIDTHRHVWQTQLKGVAIDWSLFEYLTMMRMMYSVCYEPEDAYLGNYAGALDALNTGITSIVDHSHLQITPEHSDGLVMGLKDSGIRGIMCYSPYRNPAYRPGDDVDPVKVVASVAGPLEEFHRTNGARVREKFFPSNDGLLKFGIAGSEHAFISDPGPLVEEMMWARSLEPARISLHIGGGMNRVFHIVPELQKRGLLDERILAVHGNHFTDEELKMLRDHGSGVSTTPETELQMGMGVPVLERVEKSGGLPSIGIDIASNFAGDMFAQMRILLQSMRFRHYEESNTGLPKTPRYPARKMLEFATMGGARVMGIEHETGSLTPGKKADIILTRTDSVNMTPVSDPTAALVFYADAADVDSVWIDGVARKRNGKLIGVDWNLLRGRLLNSRDGIFEKYSTIPQAALREACVPLLSRSLPEDHKAN